MLSSYSVHSSDGLYSPMHTSYPPSTPTRSSSRATTSVKRFQPRHSSPLVQPSSSPLVGSSPPPMQTSSPTTCAQERRKGQYKSLVSYRTPESSSVSRRLFSAANVGQPECSTDPAKSFLRERFQARCREHTRKARQRAVSDRRGSISSSDAGFCFSDEMDCDEEETEEDVMQDELFRRIVQNANHRSRHAYRLSYSLEVGSSFDPDLEDVSAWESELRTEPPPPPTSTSGASIPNSTTSSRVMSTSSLPLPLPATPARPSSVHAPQLTNDDPDEELIAYAALAEFADIDLSAEEFSSWSDVEDDSLEPPQVSRGVADQYDQDIDMS
ncbi:hypothetical protein EDC04DRAFT_1991416 [Pisolithus marmoratus]|nr:hypothetical protein EDC04DRAFT_1991416 [Pisolithus marmoratus]